MRYNKKIKVTSDEVKANLELLANANLKDKEPSFNLIYLNTPHGQQIIKTHLTDKEWLKENGLKLKKKR